MKKFILITFLLVAAASVQAFSQTVYASERGEKYHTADCKLSGDARGLTLAEAKRAGKGACGVCKPEEHFKDKTVQCKGKTADGTRCKRMTADKGAKCFQHKASK